MVNGCHLEGDAPPGLFHRTVRTAEPALPEAGAGGTDKTAALQDMLTVASALKVKPIIPAWCASIAAPVRPTRSATGAREAGAGRCRWSPASTGSVLPGGDGQGAPLVLANLSDVTPEGDRATLEFE